MRIDDLSFRSGKAVVAKNPEILASIYAAIVNAQEAQLKNPKVSILRYLERELSAEGWTKPEQYLSFLKKRVALSIEFSRYEFIYRDFIQFLAAHKAGKIDVAVLIISTQAAAKRIKQKSTGFHFEHVCEDLKWLHQSISVPIWVIGLR